VSIGNNRTVVSVGNGLKYCCQLFRFAGDSECLLDIVVSNVEKENFWTCFAY
jgi:hypothetical protein